MYNLKTTKNHTFILFKPLDDFKDRRKSLTEYFENMYGAKFNSSMGELQVKNTIVYLRICQVGMNRYSSMNTNNRLKVMVARDKGSFRHVNDTSYLRISEVIGANKINVTKLIESINMFALIKYNTERDNSLAQTKLEFSNMAMAGELSIDLGIDIEVHGKSDKEPNFYAKGGLYFSDNGFDTEEEINEKCIIGITKCSQIDVSILYELFIETSYGYNKLLLPLHKAKAFIMFYYEQGFLTSKDDVDDD